MWVRACVEAVKVLMADTAIELAAEALPDNPLSVNAPAMLALVIVLDVFDPTDIPAPFGAARNLKPMSSAVWFALRATSRMIASLGVALIASEPLGTIPKMAVEEAESSTVRSERPAVNAV